MSKYKIVKRNFKQAIFDNRGNRISKWWDYIWATELITGNSEYYIVTGESHKDAIFHIDNPDKPITNWWDCVFNAGLVKGKSEYYIVRNTNLEEAIFHKDNPNEPISNWWNTIWPDGLVEGKSEYYVVKNNNNKYAIIHKSGFRISDWYDDRAKAHNEYLKLIEQKRSKNKLKKLI